MAKECRLFEISKQLVKSGIVSDIAYFYNIPSSDYKTWNDLEKILRSWLNRENKERNSFMRSDHSREFLFGFIKKAAMNSEGFCVPESENPDNCFFISNHGGTIVADYNFEERPRNIFEFGCSAFLDSVSYIINLGLPSE